MLFIVDKNGQVNAVVIIYYRINERQMSSAKVIYKIPMFLLYGLGRMIMFETMYECE